ncbi:MAG: LysM peptidoglycan-binding domain-containing protein [Solirubrobacterales bacterium]|nr:LysM peptidoglycan-binding domain-containing protein [Solirubrobacterales bacterium]
MPQPSPARILAPIALVAFLVAVTVVTAGSLGGEDPASDPAPAQNRSGTNSRTPASTGESDPPSTTGKDAGEGGTVIVQAGDTPSAIAEREGIELQRLLELNPDIDVTALRTGQELKVTP